MTIEARQKHSRIYIYLTNQWRVGVADLSEDVLPLLGEFPVAHSVIVLLSGLQSMGWRRQSHRGIRDRPIPGLENMQKRWRAEGRYWKRGRRR
jgi:hypothetical protein